MLPPCIACGSEYQERERDQVSSVQGRGCMGTCIYTADSLTRGKPSRHTPSAITHTRSLNCGLQCMFYVFLSPHAVMSCETRVKRENWDKLKPKSHGSRSVQLEYLRVLEFCGYISRKNVLKLMEEETSQDLSMKSPWDEMVSWCLDWCWMMGWRR